MSHKGQQRAALSTLRLTEREYQAPVPPSLVNAFCTFQLFQSVALADKVVPTGDVVRIVFLKTVFTKPPVGRSLGVSE